MPAVECRESDETARRVARSVDHGVTRTEIAEEREFLKTVGGGCQTPIAVYAKINGETFTVSAMIGDPDTVKLVRSSLFVRVSESTGAGAVLAERMIAECAKSNIRIAR